MPEIYHKKLSDTQPVFRCSASDTTEFYPLYLVSCVTYSYILCFRPESAAPERFGSYSLFQYYGTCTVSC